MSGHPQHEEDFDLYALGALRGEECREFEAHVASCPECARRMAEARGRMALLSLAAPEKEPSTRAKERLLASLGRGQAQGGTAAPAPALLSNRWTPLLALATAALVALSVWLWHENRRLDEEVRKAQGSVQEASNQLKQARKMLELLRARDTVTVPMAPMPEGPQGRGKVMYNAGHGMLVYMGTLPTPPKGMCYQLWLVPMKGNPISAGVFNPEADGVGSVVLPSIPTGVAAKAFAVTIEPAGGMPHPTGPKVLLGEVS